MSTTASCTGTGAARLPEDAPLFVFRSVFDPEIGRPVACGRSWLNACSLNTLIHIGLSGAQTRMPIRVQQADQTKLDQGAGRQDREGAAGRTGHQVPTGQP